MTNKSNAMISLAIVSSGSDSTRPRIGSFVIEKKFPRAKKRIEWRGKFVRENFGEGYCGGGRRERYQTKRTPIFP
jgi:hypothetical protein